MTCTCNASSASLQLFAHSVSTLAFQPNWNSGIFRNSLYASLSNENAYVLINTNRMFDISSDGTLLPDIMSLNAFIQKGLFDEDIAV